MRGRTRHNPAIAARWRPLAILASMFAAGVPGYTQAGVVEAAASDRATAELGPMQDSSDMHDALAAHRLLDRYQQLIHEATVRVPALDVASPEA